VRFITLPTGELTSITVDVSRIVAVNQFASKVTSENGIGILVNGQYQYKPNDTMCEVIIDGFRDETDGYLTSSVEVTMSRDQVMACVYGFDHSRNYRQEFDEQPECRRKPIEFEFSIESSRESCGLACLVDYLETDIEPGEYTVRIEKA